MSPADFPRRGEVWSVACDPAGGGRTSPAVVVSNDVANRLLNRVQVVPLTSQTGRLYPSEADVSFGGEPRKAMADQIATIPKQRLRERIGQIGVEEMIAVNRAISVQLQI